MNSNNRKNIVQRVLHNLEARFIAPWFPVTDPEVRRRIQLLSGLLLIFLVFTLLGIVLTPLSGFNGRESFYFFLWVVFVLVVPLYVLSRTKLYRWTIRITLAFMSGFPFVALITRRDLTPDRVQSVLLWLVVGFLLGVLFLSWRSTLLLLGANFLVALALPIVYPTITYQALTPALGFLATAAALILGNIRYRDLVEEDRRKELLREKNLSDEIINGLPGIFFMYDAKRRLIRCNKKLEEVMGYSFEELAEMSTRQVLAPQNYESVVHAISQVFLEGKADIEANLITRSGASIPYYLTSLRSTVGDQPYLMGFGVDVTARKQAEAQLHKNELRYRALFEQTNDGIFILDLDANILAVNQRVCQMLGYTADEMVGMSPRQIVAPEEYSASSNVHDKLLKGESVPLYERTYVRKDGSRFIAELNVAAVYDENGKLMHIQSIVRDITERKQQQQEREKMIAELESRNAELERFTYTVSHDLKSPLITIQGFLGYVEQDARASNLARLESDMARITDATKKMSRLLNELLELSRVGRLMNPPDTVPFFKIAHDAVNRLQDRIVAYGVQVQIAQDLPAVHGDYPRLVEVVQNLVDNAVKFMGTQTQPRVEIGAQGIDIDGKPIFFVRDNGIGIESQYHQRVFGLFDKLDARTDGTGVGLTLVKRIIEVHGGKIWIESEPGKGAMFCFTLPVQA